MRRRYASMWAGALVVGLALTGCGGSGSTALGLDGSDTPSPAASAVEIAPSEEESVPSADAALPSPTPTVPSATAPAAVKLTVTSISPASGPADGDTVVTIVGTGFTTVSSVTIGGADAISVDIVSDTEITAFTPPGTVGIAEVLVINDAGDMATSGGGFTYIAKAQGPKITKATAGDGSATIAFTPALDGGGEIVNYEFSTDDGATWQQFDPPVTTSPATITKLSNGTEYLVRLRAINSAGSGASSAAVRVTPVSPVARPTKPTTSQVRVGDGWASMNFTGPALSGASAIIRYECSQDEGSTWVPCTSPWTFKGLTNGVGYHLWVRAVNAAGAGERAGYFPVVPKAPAPKPTLPTAPTITKKSQGRGTPGGWAQVEFNGPAMSGTSAITGYKCATSSSVKKGTYAPCKSGYTVTGLTKGAKYTIFVLAFNAAGSGPAASWALVSK